MKAVALPPLPTDMTDWYLLTGHLTPAQRGVWMALRCHLWQHGGLPRTSADLAAIAGVHRRSWDRMAPILEPLFDQDETGGWHDFELEEERAAEVAKRAVRAQSGRSGAQNRWRPRFVEEPTSLPDEMANAMANGMANGMANAIEEQAEMASISTALPMAFEGSGLASHGPTDGLDSCLPREILEDTDGQTDGRATAAGNGRPDGKTIPESAAADAQNAQDAMANAMANGMAKPVADAIGKTTNEEILAALRTISAGKIEPGILTPSGIAPIRAMIAEGCEFRRDILPSIAAALPGLTAPLRSLKARFIREASIASRDLAAKREAQAALAAGRFFAAVDSPEWRAWCDHLRASGRGAPMQVPNGKHMGWWFESRWPPGSDDNRERKPPAVAAE